MWSIVIAGVGAYAVWLALCLEKWHSKYTCSTLTAPTGLMFPIFVPPIRSALGYNSTQHTAPSMRQVCALIS